nr:hypothetical protein BgiMline_003450 [Biomphalaria glabrata]
MLSGHNGQDLNDPLFLLRNMTYSKQNGSMEEIHRVTGTTEPPAPLSARQRDDALNVNKLRDGGQTEMRWHGDKT